MSAPVQIYFEHGTVRIGGISAGNLPGSLEKYARYDSRSGCFRARGCDYADVVIGCRTSGIPLEDHVRNYQNLALNTVKPLTLRPHQERALQAWRANGCRGIAALPTGSGKTVLAVAAIHAMQRSALILVPTIDLLYQWSSVLAGFFGEEPGVIGGGERRIKPVTVCTYDSAASQMEFIGNLFGLLVADECHHLPGPVYRTAAAMSIAPFRLGLSATPELEADRMQVMEDLLGPVVCRVEISELEGKYLSNYEIRRINVPLLPEEAMEYQKCRSIYTAFLRANHINFRDSSAWGRFLGLCARHPEGRRVLEAFFAQRRIARSGSGKIAQVWKLIMKHSSERIIIFTADNDTAYSIGRRFMLPVITHHTPGNERKSMLSGFKSGTYPVLVTSKVLNEGVDVPEAGVGIVLSGSGSVREHVQRLGRILRPAPGKERALLYELISAGTSEEGVSARRSDHRAYRRR